MIKPKLKPDEIKIAIGLYKDGLRLNDIGKQLKVTGQTIQRLMRRYDLPKRGKGWSTFSKSPYGPRIEEKSVAES